MAADRFALVFGTGRGVPSGLALADDPRDAKMVVVRDWVARYGPHGEAVHRCLERIARLTSDELDELTVAWEFADGPQLSKAKEELNKTALPTGVVESVKATWADAPSVPAHAWEPVRWTLAALTTAFYTSREDYETLTQPWLEALGELPGA